MNTETPFQQFFSRIHSGKSIKQKHFAAVAEVELVAINHSSRADLKRLSMNKILFCGAYFFKHGQLGMLGFIPEDMLIHQASKILIGELDVDALLWFTDSNNFNEDHIEFFFADLIVDDIDESDVKKIFFTIKNHIVASLN